MASKAHKKLRRRYIKNLNCLLFFSAAATKAEVWTIDRKVFQMIMMKTSMQRHEEHLKFLKRYVSINSRVNFTFLYPNHVERGNILLPKRVRRVEDGLMIAMETYIKKCLKPLNFMKMDFLQQCFEMSKVKIMKQFQ